MREFSPLRKNKPTLLRLPNTAYSYWEGPMRFTGSHAGRGYLELTGY
jgi:predicted secreted hydrolase